MSQREEDFIQHYGKKGMRWGVRTKSSVSNGKRETERTVFSKSPKKLSSSELDRRIKRMETEKRYNELNKRDISSGQKMVTEVLTNVGKGVATKVLTGASLVAVSALLKNAMGSTGVEIASLATRKK